MTWSHWFVAPAITSFFFLLGVLTLYWFLTNRIVRLLQKFGYHPDPEAVRNIFGLLYMIVIIFGLQLSVRDSANSWVFSNFKIFAVVFVSYFLLMDIHWWEMLGTILIYMGINGTLGIPLSWIYASVYVALFYVMKAMPTRKQDHWTDYFRFIIPSLILSAILWALIGFRFHLTTTNILWEMLFIFLLLSMMYLYVDSLMTGAATLARLTYTTNFDELTHVNNYFAFKNDFEEQFAHSRTTDQPLTLMLFDIDHFKQVNDTYGHLAGDYVLSHTAQLVTKQLGELDDTLHLYRTGGEEFTILFTGYTTEQAAPLVHSIAQRVREAHFSHDGHQISISISAGVTQLHTDDDQRVDIFHRADRNLYHSKQTGRDRVTIQ